MPTVLRQDGFRFFFFSNEGTEPRHIHVQHASGYAKFWLAPVGLSESKGMKAQELAAARIIVTANAQTFMEAWDEFFAR